MPYMRNASLDILLTLEEIRYKEIEDKGKEDEDKSTNEIELKLKEYLPDAEGFWRKITEDYKNKFDQYFEVHKLK